MKLTSSVLLSRGMFLFLSFSVLVCVPAFAQDNSADNPGYKDIYSGEAQAAAEGFSKPTRMSQEEEEEVKKYVASLQSNISGIRDARAAAIVHQVPDAGALKAAKFAQTISAKDAVPAHTNLEELRQTSLTRSTNAAKTTQS